MEIHTQIAVSHQFAVHETGLPGNATKGVPRTLGRRAWKTKFEFISMVFKFDEDLLFCLFLYLKPITKYHVGHA